MGWFDWIWGKPEPEPEPFFRRKVFSTDLAFPRQTLDRDAAYRESVQLIPAHSITDADGKTYAMDALSDPSNNPFSTKNAFVINSQRIPDALMNWYSTQGFIGYQACAIMAQQWLVDKACTMPAKDAARNGWKPTINDGNEEDPELMARIRELDKRLRVTENLVELVKMKRVFGVRIALFVVESDDPDYYLKPYNQDGIKPNSYKGITQVDPYWMTPYLGEDAVKDPADIHFYEPTWWQIGSRRYHRTHLVIVRHSEVPDILKPSYLYGGIPLTQQIFERVYAAERTANEGPQLAMTKRMNVVKADLDKAFQDPARFLQRMQDASDLRDNYGTRVIGTEEDYTQHETSLADLDATIMTQYQLVAAIAEVPATKLLGTSPKGFNATGEHEIASYHEMLAGLQAHDMQPLLERHYEILVRSEFDNQFKLDVVWNPLDEPTEEQLATINKTKADTYNALWQTGAVDGEDVREVITQDLASGFSGLTGPSPEPEAGTEEIDDGEAAVA